MRLRAVAVYSLFYLLISNTAALPQNANDIIHIFGGIMRSAMARATQAEWRKLPQNEIDCIEQRLHQRGSSIGLAIQRGIMPSDQRIEDIRAFCQAQPKGQTGSTASNENSFYYVANTMPPDAFLSLRTEPSPAVGRRIKELPNGTLLQVLERRPDGWWFVRVIPSGEQGWALSGDGNKTWIACIDYEVAGFA